MLKRERSTAATGHKGCRCCYPIPDASTLRKREQEAWKREETAMPEKCVQCQAYEFKERTGSWPSGAAFHQWAMWGCTCDPQAAEDALAYIKLVSD